MSKPPIVIIHHANCPDGYSAAWVMLQSLPSAEIIAASYGDPLPDAVDGAEVFVVDFCYEPHQLVEMRRRAHSCVVLDHHHTAAGWLEESDYTVYDSVTGYMDSDFDITQDFFAIMDQEHSGVGIAMQWCDTHWPVFDHIEDRDLWRFALPDTPDVFAAVTSYGYTVDNWDEIASVPVESLAAEGKAIERYRRKLIGETLDTAFRAVLPTGDEVWCAASPYAIGSDVAGALAERSEEGWAAYFVPSGGKTRFGLRSRNGGPDVAEIAARCGGGGHKAAAGFEVEGGALA